MSEPGSGAPRRRRDLRAGHRAVATIADPEEDAGGFEGPVITPEEAADHHRSKAVNADGSLVVTATALGPAPIEQLVVEGGAGEAICALAAESGFDLSADSDLRRWAAVGHRSRMSGDTNQRELLAWLYRPRYDAVAEASVLANCVANASTCA